jgi:hypothetical protein
MKNLEQIKDYVKSFETVNIDFDDCDSFEDFKKEGIEELDVYLQEDFGIGYEDLDETLKKDFTKLLKRDWKEYF